MDKEKLKFTKAEINLCRKIAEKYRKDIEYGGWYVEPKTQKGILLWDYEDTPYFVGDQCSDTVPLWTIEDCLEFLNAREMYIAINHLFEEEGWRVQLWKKELQAFYSDYSCEDRTENKTPLEALLKAVLTVLKEE